MRSVESNIEQVFVARFLEDEDLLETIALAAKQNDVSSGFFSIIGTVKKAVLGYYKEGKYLPIRKSGPLEIVSCTGNISVKENDELVVHAHIVVSDNGGTAFGGHVLPGCLVDATAEMILVKIESKTLKRKFDKHRQLCLLDI